MPSFVSVDVDIRALKRMYSTNDCAKALLDHAAGRKKNSGKTDVDRLETILRQNGEKFSRRDVVGTLKNLEELNCGSFVLGRRGQPSRFQWAVEMIGLGKAARGEQVEVEALNEAEAEPEDVEEAAMQAGTIRHVYKVRPDFTVVLDLPEDLTTKESIRLAEFIKTLPFDSEDIA